MTNIKQKALALVKQFYPECRDDYQGSRLLMARAAIEQHEADKAAHKATIDGILQSHQAFRQQVSDAVTTWWLNPPILFQQFIIPAPKPDPLVDAMNDINIGAYENIKTEYADTLRADIVRRFRAALDARGLQIVEKNDD